jgi:hypothetical protein
LAERSHYYVYNARYGAKIATPAFSGDFRNCGLVSPQTSPEIEQVFMSAAIRSP